MNVNNDAMGNRISKTVTNKNETNGDKFVTTYYVRDPQGNVLAVYEHKHGDSGNGTFTLTEQHLYGAGRLGMRKRDLALNVANANESTPPATHYELTNHLGNVMAVISDKASDTSEPTVVSLSDYYPFGMTEPGRNLNAGDYRFGYTGHEKENDLAEGVYTTEYRLLDTRLGRWMSVDPLFAKYADMSSYNYCLGSPVIYWDLDGREKHLEHYLPLEHPLGWYINKYNSLFVDNKKKADDELRAKNERLNASAEKYPDQDNVYHVFCHGNRTSVVLEDNKVYDASQFYMHICLSTSDLIDNNVANGKTTIIFLHSCSTGDTDGPGDCFAAELSSYDDYIVIAPSKTLHRSASGEETVYDEGTFINSGGYYNVFYKGELIESYGGYKEEGLLEGLFGEDVGETVNMPEKLKNFNVDEIKKKYEEKHGDSNQ